MGSNPSKWCGRAAAENKVRCLMVGFAGSGKMTLLYQLVLGLVVTTMPTQGVNVEDYRYKDLTFRIKEFGGGTGTRPLWKLFIDQTQAVLFVVDGQDRLNMTNEDSEYLGETLGNREALHGLMEHLDANVPVIVFVNKQDLAGCMAIEELVRVLHLRRLRQPWCINKCCSLTMHGAEKNFEWLHRTFSRAEPALCRLGVATGDGWDLERGWSSYDEAYLAEGERRTRAWARLVVAVAFWRANRKSPYVGSIAPLSREVEALGPAAPAALFNLDAFSRTRAFRNLVQ